MKGGAALIIGYTHLQATRHFPPATSSTVVDLVKYVNRLVYSPEELWPGIDLTRAWIDNIELSGDIFNQDAGVNSSFHQDATLPVVEFSAVAPRAEHTWMLAVRGIREVLEQAVSREVADSLLLPPDRVRARFQNPVAQRTRFDEATRGAQLRHSESTELPFLRIEVVGIDVHIESLFAHSTWLFNHNGTSVACHGKIWLQHIMGMVHLTVTGVHGTLFLHTPHNPHWCWQWLLLAGVGALLLGTLTCRATVFAVGFRRWTVTATTRYSYRVRRFRLSSLKVL